MKMVFYILNILQKIHLDKYKKVFYLYHLKNNYYIIVSRRKYYLCTAK